jgi:hypothetical protein
MWEPALSLWIDLANHSARDERPAAELFWKWDFNLGGILGYLGNVRGENSISLHRQK